MNISIDATHTWVADLDSTVTFQPSNTSVLVMDEMCVAGQDNVDATFDSQAVAGPDCIEPIAVEGDVLPTNDLGAFNGLANSGNGTWRITINDDTNQDGGTLDGWCIVIDTDANEE